MKKLLKKLVNKRVFNFLKRKLISIEKRNSYISNLNFLSKYKKFKMIQNINRLPINFDEEIYLKLNPDVKKAGLDPKKHFLEYGRKEKRLWQELSEKKFLNKEDKFLRDNYWQWLKVNDPDYLAARKLSIFEESKKYKRTDVINKILSKKLHDTAYLEIGVRNPEDNFNAIKSSLKYSVDPGLEVKTNKADFKLTSDNFFKLLSNGEVLSKDCRFDVIFIDGLHLADQVDRDIDNALDFIKDDGFVVLHDCNPPTEWHARETYGFYNSPADGAWNGTVWKAFLKRRFEKSLYSCCIDTDWGVGIISKNINIGSYIKKTNTFFEYKEFNNHRKEYLNLISFEEFSKIL